jgi:hypothetical protein
MGFAFGAALIYEVAGEASVAAHCRENAIGLSHVRSVPADIIGNSWRWRTGVFVIEAGGCSDLDRRACDIR